MGRGYSQLRRSEMPRVSNRRLKELLEYSKRRKIYLRQRPLCSVCSMRRARHIHHIHGRNGQRLLDERFWMAICPGCHRKIHDYPALAREKGYLL